MPSGWTIDPRRSLTARLVILYSAVLILWICAVGSISYLLVDRMFRADIDAFLTQEAIEFQSVFRSRGLDAVELEVAQEAAASGTDLVFYRLLNADGDVLFESDQAGWERVPTDSELVRWANSKGRVFVNWQASRRTNDARVMYAALGADTVLQAAYSKSGVVGGLKHVSYSFLLTGLAAALLATLAGVILTRRALSGVLRIRDTAERIVAGDLSSRVQVDSRDDEINQVGMAINLMLDRISAFVEQLKRVVDNMAHEVRGPLTRIRGGAEVALGRVRSVAEYQEFLADVVDDCDDLLRVADTLLIISETEAGIAHTLANDVSVDDLVRPVGETYDALAESQNVSLILPSPSGRLVRGDPVKLQLALSNLMDNAIKYTHDGGFVSVNTAEVAGWVEIRVCDSGPGISEEDLPHVFERFYRGDKSRTAPGAGLGLCLARAIARAHGGDVSIERNSPRGTCVILRLPSTPGAIGSNVLHGLTETLPL